MPPNSHVGRRSALKLPVVVAAGMALTSVPRASAELGRWSPDRAHRWHRAQGWLVGANFLPANAINQLEMFQPGTFDLRRIDTELRMAKFIGLNTVRVFLHDLLWVQDRPGFQRRLAKFVDLAAHHGIKPLFVLFDSCWDPHPRLGKQRDPIPGVHNSGWVQSPGADHLGDPGYRRVMRDYVTGVLSQFRHDKRVLGWDLWNEPDNPAEVYKNVERKDKIERVGELLPQVFQWARSVDPVQPLTSGVWDGVWGDPARRNDINRMQLDLSDVISFHNYADPKGFNDRLGELFQFGRPMLCTEYMARTLGSTVEAILPIMKRHNIGAYTWGFVAGKSQTYLPWDSWKKPVTAPQLWFHDLLNTDGSPYRPGEINTIKALTGKDRPN